MLDPAKPVYFAHIPRSGGTTLTRWVNAHLAGDERYPGTEPALLVAQKMFPGALGNLSAEQRARIRFYAPHLPVAAHELLDRPVSVITLVREPIDQIRSLLDLQSAGDIDLDTRFRSSINLWYETNQLGWYLGADLDDVAAVFDRVHGVAAERLGVELEAALTEVMADKPLVERACRRVDSIALVGLADRREPVMEALGEWLGGVTPVQARANRGRGRPLPSGLHDELHELTASDRAIYAYVRGRVQAGE